MPIQGLYPDRLLRQECFAFKKRVPHDFRTRSPRSTRRRECGFDAAVQSRSFIAIIRLRVLEPRTCSQCRFHVIMNMLGGASQIAVRRIRIRIRIRIRTQCNVKAIEPRTLGILVAHDALLLVPEFALPDHDDLSHSL